MMTYKYNDGFRRLCFIFLFKQHSNYFRSIIVNQTMIRDDFYDKSSIRDKNESLGCNSRKIPLNY